MESQCDICRKVFSSERSMESHKGWHKIYQRIFEAEIQEHLRRLRPLDHAAKSTKVKIEIGESLREITVRPCNADGQCLFEALWFQTIAEDYDYSMSAVKEFKKAVLQTIRDDEEYYRPFIEEHLVDLMNDDYFTEYEPANDKEQKRMRDVLLEKIGTGDEWGGSETIAAVKDMYKVNCVSFNVGARTFHMQNFEKLYHGIVFVAFKDLNHYDTVINIKDEDIPEIARILAKRVV